MILVNTITATYALTHRNAVSRGYEMVKGVVKGDIPDVNKVREISKEEIESCKSSVPMRTRAAIFVKQFT